MPVRYEVIGVESLPEIRPGDDLGQLLAEAAHRQGTPLQPGDLLIVCQKIVSKAEGRLVRMEDVVPSPRAEEIAGQLAKDPRLVEIILRETRQIIRMDKGILVVETRHGLVCANAGVDRSNVDADTACLLPEDPDRSAEVLRAGLARHAGHDVPVIITDTFGRPWREGLANVAIGVAGVQPLRSYLGERDPAGNVLQATVIALADELAAAAEPVMGKLSRIPAALIRGLDWQAGAGSARELLRDPTRDIFR
ncbi:MAG TPA: coenzyme F420-0:L-glutamate ligase [Candidatus Binatia bacterium]|nr:coenzyme F420-0:L-glutamate ligase [Candidatus Binatia bacterium]